jgi:SAM-dependent methyltransferase
MDAQFFNYMGRLAQYSRGGNHQSAWEERWSRHQIREKLLAYSSGKLDEFDAIFSKYLPRELPVLEAGCGLGQLVMALSSRGYSVEGVDYAEQTVVRIREAAPELKVRVGDVYNLDVPDKTYGGYISIGIFEHNPDGPFEGLREVRRVLHPQGVALISVPYLNAIRKNLLRRSSKAEGLTTADGLSFYQYYFSRADFQEHLVKAGLEIVDIIPYGVYTGLTRDSSLGGWLDQKKFFHWRVRRGIVRLCQNSPGTVHWRFAHMIMFVCQRNG